MLLCGFYVVAMVPGVVAKVVAMQLLGYSGVVLGYPSGCQGVAMRVAMVPWGGC